MQDQPNEQMRAWDVMEREVVYILTDPGRYPPIWSVADLGREIEYFDPDPDAVIRPLVNAGLVHKTSDGYVLATAAAFRMVQFTGHVV
jgi:hypothetical protein